MSARKQGRRLTPYEVGLRDGTASHQGTRPLTRPSPELAVVPTNPSAPSSSVPPAPSTSDLAPVFAEPNLRQSATSDAPAANEPATWRIGHTFQVDANERRAALERIQPRGPRAEVTAVRGTVIELIMAVEHTGTRTDRQLMSAGTAFALFCRGTTPDGQFRPERDLNELKIHDFLVHELGENSQGTRATYASSIRRLAGDRTFRSTSRRDQAQAPYTRTEARELWNAAFAYDDWTAIEMRTLLALTLGAGCLSEEILVLRASQVDRTPHRVVVSVARKHFVREVPVYDKYAKWLIKHATTLSPDDLLFRATYNDRRNAISHLVQRSKTRTDAFTGFRAAKARHHWLCQHLQVGVAFNALSVAAGVGKNSNLFADLLPYLPTLQPIDIHRAFDRAYLTAQEPS